MSLQSFVTRWSTTVAVVSLFLALACVGLCAWLLHQLGAPPWTLVAIYMCAAIVGAVALDIRSRR